MSREDFFISAFKSHFNGDDGAIVGDLVFSKDLFCEDIHFKLEWMSLSDIARKSILVNISDAIAMNALPKYILLGIKIPRDFSKKQLKELQEGFLQTAKDYGIEIIGGDTIIGDKLDISITLISKTKKALYRKGLKKGDLLIYSGSLGGSLKDFKKASRGVVLNKRSRFVAPTLRGEFVYRSSRYFTSMIDISDGLSKELSRLSKINKVGFRFFKKLEKYILCSGEEYEILFSCKQKDIAKIKKIAKKYRVKLNIFAKATRGNYKSVCKEHHK